MNRLWVQLTLAFGLVTLLALLVVGLLVNRQVETGFRRFVAADQLTGGGLAGQLTDYYAAQGSWAGVETLFANQPGPGQGPGRGMMRGGPGLVLADASGRVVYAARSAAPLERLDRADLASATPLVVDGQTIGYLLALAPGRNELTQQAQHFLNQVNQALLQAGLLAGILGLLLGLVIARSLAAPLNRLARAAQRVAAGDLSQRVEPAGAAEVAAVGRSFNLMATSLEQAEQARQAMVADIAHELRTPLSVVQGNLQAILDGVYPLDATEIQVVYDETLVLHRLIDDLRELARAEAGQLDLALQPIDLAALIERSRSLFAERAAEQGITLQATPAAGVPRVQADLDRTRQVLHNLLANALRYTPAGGTVTLAVEELPTQKFVRVTVADTGTGIAPGDLPHVFERFWRADRSRSRAQGGSGLGLAIAERLVTAQGGAIGVDSVLHQGSRFWFTLPVCDEGNVAHRR